MAAGKIMRHGCGYPLRIGSMGFVGDEAVVVIYREVEQFSLPLYHCPQCGEELQLWWDAPPTEVMAQRQRRQQELARWFGTVEGDTDG